MLIDILGAKCIGIEAVPVTVEVDITQGIGIHLVGLADAALKEHHRAPVAGLPDSGKEDRDQSGTGRCAEERQWL